MFKNYFKIAQRNMQKNKLHSLFNILGLALGIGTCIAVFLFINLFTTMDLFHKDGKNIFMIGHIKLNNNNEERWGQTPAALGPAVLAAFPEVRQMLRIETMNAAVKYGDKVFNEQITLADANFFDMLTFPLKSGRNNALADKSSLIISERMAKKYFGNDDPIGKTLSIIFDEEHKYEYAIKGVAEKFPYNASFFFSFLVNYEIRRYIIPNASGWDHNVSATFLQLKPHTQSAKLEKQIQRFVATYNSIVPDNPIQSFYLDNLRNISKNSPLTRANISYGMFAPGMQALAVIAALLLVMVCFNYMNNIIAVSARRFKEIGIRKVLGSSRMQLIQQFLTENIVTSLFALAAGVIFAKTIFIPFLNRFTETDGNFMIALRGSDTELIVFLALLVVTIGVTVGLYPALYMSRLEPAKILKHMQRLGGDKILTRILLTLQFAITIFAVFAAIVFARNAEYFRNMDLGFKGEQVAVFNFDKPAQLQLYKNAVATHPAIAHIAYSQDQIVASRLKRIVGEYAGKKYYFNIIRIGADYLETLGMQVIQGRSFSDKLKTDVSQAIMVNHTLAQEMGWANPIGQQLRLEGSQYSIIGEVKNFHEGSTLRPIPPYVLRFMDKNECTVLSIKINTNDLSGLRSFFEKQWFALFPDTPFEIRFQNQLYEPFYQENDNIKMLFIFIAVMTMVIAAMGLFALVSANIERRVKEIAIRKVLGAKLLHIIQLVNKEFYLLILAASILIFPIAYIMLKNLLDVSYRIGHVKINAIPFIGSAIIMLLLAVITVGARVYKAAVENPVKALKHE
jgi:putative ABC transport system permease protein